MQDFMYSVFSSFAIAIHLIVNFRLLAGRGESSVRGRRYRGFLFGILAYYVTDATWGLLAGLGWTRALYVETAFFFLGLVTFVFMWSHFVVSYLELGKRAARILTWYGIALTVYNLAGLAANPFADCFYHFDAQGVYHTDYLRDPAFALLVVYTVLTAFFSGVKAFRRRDSVRRRSLMVFLFSVIMGVSIVLQVLWPLTPFTALGCLVGNCFFHIFVVEDEHMARHAATLEKALERARAAEKARSLFFSIVSHDIRTPLNAILGYSELLRRGIPDPAGRAEALDSIRASGTTLLDLVNDVLDLAKMDAGKMTLQPEPVLLSRLTDEVFASFRLVATRKGIELVNRTAGVPAVLLDNLRFHQILFNLVGNAVKFTERGAVTVSASLTGKNLEVTVSDTGCGIPPDMLTRVLDPFVQVQDPTHSRDRANGTGLGLSICKRLVEAMGGKLLVESEPGKGSAFRAFIPGIEAREDQTDALAAPKPASGERKLPGRVLVVDDSPVNRSVLTAFLKKAGVASIDHAADGLEGLAKLDSALKEGRPHDFVFSDYWMPNMNGLEFVEKLRADDRFARLPVFAVTADTETQREPRTALFTGVLLKPLTYGKLLEVVAARNVPSPRKETAE